LGGRGFLKELYSTCFILIFSSLKSSYLCNNNQDTNQAVAFITSNTMTKRTDSKRK
jgi:hypothetical protein